jgi:hypothetical protein
LSKLAKTDPLSVPKKRLVQAPILWLTAMAAGARQHDIPAAEAFGGYRPVASPIPDAKPPAAETPGQILPAARAVVTIPCSVIPAASGVPKGASASRAA